MPASPFPPYSLSEALIIAETIVKHNAGKPMRRLTIFDMLQRSPSSGPSRQLITASSGYGLTQGGHNAEMISLTERGVAILVQNDPKAKIDAILNVEIFKLFFDNYHNSTLPSNSAAIDFLKNNGIAEGNAQSCLAILLKNGENVKLIQEISGVKRIVTVDHALETLSKSSGPVYARSDRDSEDQTRKNETLGEETSKPDRNNFESNSMPSIHIDIQIHISSDSTNEQIDQVFASMAKHLYPSRKPIDG